MSSTAEPQIYSCTQKFGTILENVVYNPVTRQIDLNDDSITENTRPSYPLGFIDNSILQKRAGHPKNIIFLTCDASGVMPPLAKLSTDQAIYHFLSGYTSKIAGTEIGLGKEPEITFSACFGAPFMVLNPSFYANILKNKIERYKVNCWLVNTGWVGGPYGVGKRISINYTRQLLNAVLNDRLIDIGYYQDPIIGFYVPKNCPGVPDDVLFPATSWSNPESYLQRYKSLASRFIDNFKKFEVDTPHEILNAGSKIH